MSTSESNGGPAGTGTGTGTAAVVRRLDSPAAATLVDLLGIFDDLQTVLACCEKLVTEVAAPHPETNIAIEAAWTTALLSYTRCFAPRASGTSLTESDAAATQPEGDLLGWHQALVRLRGVFAAASVNPREQFTVGVVQEKDGSAGGVAITSVRQPQVNDLTVRQTGAMAFALSEVVNTRIEEQQARVFTEVRQTSRAELDALDKIDVVTDGSAGTASM
jgi:hypothetical protein